MVIFYSYKKYVRKIENKISFDRRVLNIPLLGNFILNSELERFSSTMELLLASGTNLDVALDECSKIFDNKFLSRIIFNAKNDVVEGKDFIVSIKNDGSYWIDQSGENQNKNLNEIKQLIEKILSQSPEKQILIWGDEKVDYGSVVLLMSELQKVGATSVGLITDPPRD